MTEPTRRIFIGDVHGCADELDELLERVAYDPASDAVWFVGDLANRGPHPLRAIRRAREVATGVVLGNHDLHLLGVAAGERDLRPVDTIDAVLEASDREELLAWLRAQPLLVEWEDLILVHAGLSPAWESPRSVASPLERGIATGFIPWENDDLSFLTRVRKCDADGRVPTRGARTADLRPWDEFHRGPRTVVFGHWAARGLVHEEHRRGLDSGCVWGGSLSAWIAEEDRLVSVPARRTYQQP